jgi:hypothetical protein
MFVFSTFIKARFKFSNTSESSGFPGNSKESMTLTEKISKIDDEISLFRSYMPALGVMGKIDTIYLLNDAVNKLLSIKEELKSSKNSAYHDSCCFYLQEDNSKSPKIELW